MNPTVKAVLLNERAAVLSAIAARQGTISDLMVQINGVENDIWRLRHRLIDLEAYLIGHRVALPEDAEEPGAAAGGPEAGQVPQLAPADDAGPSEPDADGLPVCKPLADFVRPRLGSRRPQAGVAVREIENV
jgi:hypothetical protein